MQQIHTSRTLEHIQTLFSRDAETLLRYRCFAAMSRNEGAVAVADLFDRLAESQLIMAEGHLDVLRNVGDPFSGLPLTDNQELLQASIAAETHDTNELVPTFASVADAEGFASVASWIRSVGLLKTNNINRLSLLLNEANGSTEVEE
jgi:rubrerythrin